MVKIVAINLATGEEVKIGQGDIEIASGAIDEESDKKVSKLGESYSGEFIIKPKKIKKKRFIKLVMSKGIQRNIANIIHQEYMKTHEVRTYLGMWFFITGLIREIEEE